MVHALAGGMRVKNKKSEGKVEKIKERKSKKKN